MALLCNHGPCRTILQVPADGGRCPEPQACAAEPRACQLPGHRGGGWGCLRPQDRPGTSPSMKCQSEQLPLTVLTTPQPCAAPSKASTLDPRSCHPLSQRSLRLSKGDPLVPKHQSIYWQNWFSNLSSLTAEPCPEPQLTASSNLPSTVSPGSGPEVVCLQTWTVPRGWNQVPRRGRHFLLFQF